jgi:hypothetical protein
MRGDPIRRIQRLRMVEVLWEVVVAGRKREWFEGKVPSTDERTEQATYDLLRMGFIQSLEGYPGSERHPYRLTQRSRAFLDDAVARIGKMGPGGVISIDWGGADEIEFPPVKSE